MPARTACSARGLPRATRASSFFTISPPASNALSSLAPATALELLVKERAQRVHGAFADGFSASIHKTPALTVAPLRSQASRPRLLVNFLLQALIRLVEKADELTNADCLMSSVWFGAFPNNVGIGKLVDGVGDTLNAKSLEFS